MRKTFVSISDTIHNGSVSAALVDLEGTSIAGAANINLGAGGGYVLTDYSLDLGNSSNDGANTSAPNVSISGDLTVTDLRSRFDDAFELYSGNVAGNVSINVSGININEDQIYLQNYLVGENLEFNASVTANYDESISIANSSIAGIVNINESGTASDASASINASTITGQRFDHVPGLPSASLTVTQSNGHSDEFDAFGNDSNSINGSVSITQGAKAYNETSITDWSTIHGGVNVNQSTASASFAVVAADSITGSVGINQTTSAVGNSAYFEDDSITGSGRQPGSHAGPSEAIVVDLSVQTGVFFNGDSITGNVMVNQAVNNGAWDANTGVNSSKIYGSMTVYQTAADSNDVNISQNASVVGALTINQSNALASEDDVFVDNSSMSGGVSINEAGGSGSGSDSITLSSSKINGSATIAEGGAGEFDQAYIENTSVTVGVTINQAAAASDSIWIETNSSSPT